MTYEQIRTNREKTDVFGGFTYSIGIGGVTKNGGYLDLEDYDETKDHLHHKDLWTSQRKKVLKLL